MLENLISKLWNNPKNKRLVKDFLLFSAATVAFHFLYWNTDMNKWLFGPFTNSIFNLFTSIAYDSKNTELPDNPDFEQVQELVMTINAMTLGDV